MKDRFPQITPLALNQRINSGATVTLVDVRSTDEFRAGHIPGAHSIPLDDLKDKGLTNLASDTQLDAYNPLYLTCQAGVRAEQAANMLQGTGVGEIRLVKGGTEAWQKAGLPVKRLGAALTLEQQVQIALGSLLILKVVFGFTVHELFFVAGAVIGAGLVVAGFTRWCGLRQLMARLPWNRRNDYGHENPA